MFIKSIESDGAAKKSYIANLIFDIREACFSQGLGYKVLSK